MVNQEANQMRLMTQSVDHETLRHTEMVASAQRQRLSSKPSLPKAKQPSKEVDFDVDKLLWASVSDIKRHFTIVNKMVQFITSLGTWHSAGVPRPAGDPLLFATNGSDDLNVMIAWTYAQLSPPSRDFVSSVRPLRFRSLSERPEWYGDSVA
ncbi:hypothetical protein E1B28_013529 [Marasmius oreades]|uniref:Uncharacterized protein n=1 Tax=Marasmius oreades TaxID=181124 RepID=A0A9P7UN43_9AGAR|nr:uncharacterized protein E1B28_013529 [Marasmius oreades]KAG7087575.1 hypothetical protein E1B28_013529 [Marasmius oreades]